MTQTNGAVGAADLSPHVNGSVQHAEPERGPSGPLADPASAAPDGARAGAAVPVIRTVGLAKDYRLGSTTVHALRGVDLVVARGEFVAVMGPSGSGKSTFMNLVGCLDRPSAGEYWLDGAAVGALGRDALSALRNRKLGFIFQGFNLLPKQTALGNVALPMLYAGLPGPARKARALAALALVGLAERAHHKPSELSGGQQQRVAIARALVNDPALLLADEPTGNLDSRTSVEVMATLQELNQAGITILLVTHEPDIASFCGRNVTFRDGRVVRDERVAQPRVARKVLPTLPVIGEEAVA